MDKILDQDMDLENVKKNLIEALPPVFGRKKIDELLPGIITSKRLANLESLKQGPKSFLMGGSRMYCRQSFIEWLLGRIKSNE